MNTKKSERLRVCTECILEGIAKQFDAGIALIEVRDDKLYVEAGFDTLEDYCREVLKISRARAYQIMEATEIKESLPSSAAKQITNPHQALALADVPEKERPKVINEASKSGAVTAASIAAAADKMSTIVDKDQPVKMGKSRNGATKNGTVKRVIELDDVGTPIPEDAIPFWHRRQEIQDLLTDISRIKCLIEKHRNENDPLFAKVSNGVVSELQLVYSQMLEAKPYAVCTTCMGRFTVQPKGCSFCGNKGLISKWQWDTQSRKEIKDMVLKSNAGRARA